MSFFAAARWFGLRPLTAAAAALLAPLVSTNFLYGIEYGSFTWAGSGLYPQAVAANFLLLSLGSGFRALRTGRRLTLAGILLGLTFLSHFIYGYMGALSLALLTVIPDAAVAWTARLRRMVWVGVAAAALAAFEIAPLLIDGTINHSRWEFVWKWDSFGAAQVLRWLFTGELLDHGRLLVLTALAFAGAAWFAFEKWTRRKPAKRGLRQGDPGAANPAHLFILLAAALWIAMFFGRPFWGPLLDVLGVSRDMQLHRVIGGAQIFLVFLAAIGLTETALALWRHRRYGTVALLLAVALYPALADRWKNLSQDATWGRTNLAAYDAAKDSIDAAIAIARQRGGRVYPGLAATWGGKFKVGDVPFHGFLSRAQVPAVAFLYHSMALTSDLMVRFNEGNPNHYRLFNIQTVIAPVQGGPALPPFVIPVAQTGPFRIYAAPGGGYFDLVDVPAAVTTSHNDFFDVNDRWMASDWVALRRHLLLDWSGRGLPAAPASLPRISPDSQIPMLPPMTPPLPGAIAREQQNGEIYEAEFDAVRDCYALFKMTWHANWKAEVDGKPVATVMLSPGFPGVRVSAGPHRIRFRYEPEWWRSAGAIAGVLIVLLMAFGERQGMAVRAEAALARLPALASLGVRRRALTAAGLLLLALPVCVSLFSGQVLAGHDSFEYFPRLTEFHENIAHGILWPRWAPDLTFGNGQPLFLFNPPLIYYAGELWHLVGFSFVTAMNLACVLVVLASAAAMFLLGKLYFGERGGWLAAAALLYAPYFAVDLYVRSAMAELAAFPCLALALYGFGAYARYRKRWLLLLGAAAFAAVIMSHNVATLFSAPLLAAFIVFAAWHARDRRLFVEEACGYLLGLGLGAAVWLPGLLERGDIHIERLLEGYLRYSNHFVYLQQLFYSPWGYGISVAGPNDQMSFSLGWAHLVVAGAVWILAIMAARAFDRRWLQFFTAAGVVLCFITLTSAQWIWDSLLLLQYAEFPWRFLLPAAICLALLVGALGQLLDVWPIPALWKRVAFTAAMALIIVPNLPHLLPPQLRDVDPIFWTPQQIAARGLEVTTAREYVPRWVLATPERMMPAALVTLGDAQVRQTGRTPVSWSGTVVAKQPSSITLATFWFPGWKTMLDGREVETEPALATGQIRLKVPAGEHRVEVVWERTGIVWLADAISVVSVAAFFVLAFVFRREKTEGPSASAAQSVSVPAEANS